MAKKKSSVKQSPIINYSAIEVARNALAKATGDLQLRISESRQILRRQSFISGRLSVVPELEETGAITLKIEIESNDDESSAQDVSLSQSDAIKLRDTLDLILGKSKPKTTEELS